MAKNGLHSEFIRSLAVPEFVQIFATCSKSENTVLLVDLNLVKNWETGTY